MHTYPLNSIPQKARNVNHERNDFMEIKITGTTKEVAELVLALQEQTRQKRTKYEKIPECLLLTLIDQMQKKISERVVKNAKMPYYPNMTLLECFDYFNIDIEQLFNTDQIHF